MPSPTYDPNHGSEAQTALPEEYKGKTRLGGVLLAFTAQIQLIEDAALGSSAGITTLFLANASGIWLDVIGKIVGQPRNGQADGQYRLFLGARIALNRSSGTIENILTTFAILTAGLGITLRLDEYFPKALLLRFTGAAVPDATATSYAGILKSAKDAGAKAFVEYGNTAPFFGWDGSTGAGWDTGYWGGSI